MKVVGDLKAGSLGDLKRKPKTPAFNSKPPGKRKGNYRYHECKWIRGAEIEICTKCGAERPIAANAGAQRLGD